MSLRQLNRFIACALVVTMAATYSPLLAGNAQTIKTLDAATRVAVIEGALKALNENYVFPEMAKQMDDAIRARLQRGEYDQFTDAAAFAARLTDDLRAVCRDKHLRVAYNAEPLPQRDGPLPGNAVARDRVRNFGFEKVERLEGNIGYLDLRGFMDVARAAETATAAMNFLAHTDALIIDLRRNGGGQPEMVAFLSSYLFDKPTHLNDIYERPTNRTQQFWTRAEVPGQRYLNKPVYVLTSKYTFSGGEEFSYNLKNLKRATLIGETTGGGAHPVSFRRINDHFGIAVPFGRAINPITKTNWEGTGVTPDVPAAAAQALQIAHLAALKQVLAATTDARRAEELKIVIASLQRTAEPPATASAQPSAQSAAQTVVALPDTPAGKTLAAFLKAFNTGDLATLKSFHKERGGNEENAQQDLNFYQQSGGLKLHSVTRAEQFEVEVLAQAQKDGRWLSFAIGVEQQAPYALADIRVRPAAAPANNDALKPAANSSQPSTPSPATGTSKKPASEPELLKEVASLVDRKAADDSFSGVVVIAKDGRPIFQRAVGLANKAYNVPNRVDTKFNLGSINKAFTGVAIMQLAAAGKLALSDSLIKHLPDYPNKQAAAKITIQQLLDMKSGIGDFFGARFEATPKDRLRMINDYLVLFADQPLLFEPGQGERYSNGGYIVLGAIIEKITGQSYFDYVREHIFKPAGMENTDYYEVDDSTPNLATGYTKRGSQTGKLVSNVYTKPARGSSAGGGYSTAEDLLKFARALQNNKLPAPERLRGAFGIAGGAPGINAMLLVGPADGYTVIVLSNYDPPSAEDLGQQLRQGLSRSN
jgi:CubicO group peptidase (beta-lactamase class C family)